MNRIDRIIRETINKAVNEIIREDKYPLFEAKRNVTAEEYDSVMQDLGYYPIPDRKGSRVIYKMTGFGDIGCVTAHLHKGKPVAPGALSQAFKCLNYDLRWCNNKKLIELFPFDAWELKAKRKEILPPINVKEEIQEANETYKDAVIFKLYPTDKDSRIFGMKFNNQFNLCRGSMDRRPLYDEWFDEIGYDETYTIPYAKKCIEDENGNLPIVGYRIFPDGTLDTEHPINENRRYGKGKHFKVF